MTVRMILVNFHETNELFIARARAAAEQAYAGDTNPVEGVSRSAAVVFAVTAVTTDHQMVAAAWLQGPVKDLKLGIEQVALDFGYLVAGMIRSVVYPQTLLFWGRADSRVQTLMLAISVSRLVTFEREDWCLLPEILETVGSQLQVMAEADPYLQGMVRGQIKNARTYLKEVVGNAPHGTARLSIGYPSTLGAYRLLTATAFGRDSLAVKWLDDEIARSANGVGEVVSAPEQQMLEVIRHLVTESSQPELGAV